MALAIDGMKAGAADFINKPWENSNLLQSIKTAIKLNNNISDSITYDRKKLDRLYDFSKIVGNNPQLLNILSTIGKVSNTNASVLITGESGTGKELIAEALHMNSNRKDENFVKVNLGGISTSLFESEMFGHVRGAFTDAHFDRKGRFEEADGGTIFLDEIGELEMSSQVKLLRVLQERKFEVLGSSRTKSVDVRVVCATNRDLMKMVSEGKFREDLYYRINLVTVNLPSLRERKEDIPLMIQSFLTNLKTIYSRPELEITAEALEWLKELCYYGNVRELKNLVERSILVNHKNLLGIREFKEQLQTTPKSSQTKILPAVGEMSLEEMEVTMIKKAMEFHKNKVREVANSLGISRNALYRRLEKYNIDYEKE
jgi:DNA-binding NtrC family response regulator